MVALAINTELVMIFCECGHRFPIRFGPSFTQYPISKTIMTVSTF